MNVKIKTVNGDARKNLIYICSPLRGNYHANILIARQYCRDVIRLRSDAIPIAPHVFFTQFLDDEKPKERELGMDMGLVLLEKCSEVWVFGIDQPSEGMMREIRYARELGIPVYDALEMYKPKKE